MHHLAIESCLFQRLLVVCEFHMGYMRTYTGLCGYSHVYVDLEKIKDEKSSIWVCHRPSGTGLGGAYILLIMLCWNYRRRSWFNSSVVLNSGGASAEGEHGY